MKKVVLVMPNNGFGIDLDIKKDPPMGILYIAKALQKGGFDVSIIDAFGANMTSEEILKELIAIKPNFVGISCNYSTLHNQTLELSDKIKVYLKDTIVFIGGNHATAAFEYILMNSNAIDCIALGQGESSVTHLLEGIQNGKKFSEIAGIAYLEGNTVVKNEKLNICNNLDYFDFPAYELVDMNNYDRYNIISSRGCPYSCTYCASNVITDKKVNYRSAMSIVKEVEYLLQNHGDKLFWFSDDTFTANQKFTNELLDLIIQRNLKFRWSCLTRVNKTSRELLVKMKEAGCQYVSYGVESGNTNTLNKMNKKITISQVKETILLTKEIGLPVYTFFLIGYPGDTLVEIEDSFRLLEEIRPDGASFAVVIPLPGTEMWKQLELEGLVSFDTIKWDYLFAKTGSHGLIERYSAELAATWCSLTPDVIIALCERGNNMFR